jgi:hypothetical protein
MIVYVVTTLHNNTHINILQLHTQYIEDEYNTLHYLYIQYCKKKEM